MAMLSAWLFVLGFFLRYFTKEGAIPLSNFDDVIDTYLQDIYRISLYLVRDEELAQKITRQAFLEFYDRFEEVKEELIFAELANTAKKLAETYKASSEGEEV